MFQSPEMRGRSRRLVTRWKMPVNACKIAESYSRCDAVGNWDFGIGIGSRDLVRYGAVAVIAPSSI